MWQKYFTFTTSLSYAVEVCWCWTSYNLILNKIILAKLSVFSSMTFSLVVLEEIDISLKCTHLKWNTKFLWRRGLGHPWNEWCVGFRCSRILINLQMFSIILRSGDWDGQTRQSTSLLSFHNFVCTNWCTGALSSWKIHWLFSNFATTGQRLLSRMSMYLAELIFPSTSVIVPTPSLQIHNNTWAPPLRRPYSPKHSVFHLSSAFHHTYPREFFPS